MKKLNYLFAAIPLVLAAQAQAQADYYSNYPSPQHSSYDSGYTYDSGSYPSSSQSAYEYYPQTRDNSGFYPSNPRGFSNNGYNQSYPNSSYYQGETGYQSNSGYYPSNSYQGYYQTQGAPNYQGANGYNSSPNAANYNGSQAYEQQNSFDNARAFGHLTQDKFASPQDHQIAIRIRQMLADNRIEPSNITLSVQNGTVTLQGSVSDESTKKQVSDMIKNINGVNQVDNQLQVNGSQNQTSDNYSPSQSSLSQQSPSSVNSDNQPSSSFSNSPSTYPNSASAYPSSTNTYPSSTNTYPNSSSSYQNPNSSYQNPNSNYPNSNSAYPNNPNTNSSANPGSLAYTSSNSDATSTAFSNSTNPKDSALVQRIQTWINNEPSLSGTNIQVDANNGKVVLSGDVSTNRQKMVIGQKVKQISGVKSVDNEINVNK